MPFVIGVHAAAIMIAGYFYILSCFIKVPVLDNEGGNREDKKLFKKVIRGKT